MLTSVGTFAWVQMQMSAVSYFGERNILMSLRVEPKPLDPKP